MAYHTPNSSVHNGYRQEIGNPQNQPHSATIYHNQNLTLNKTNVSEYINTNTVNSNKTLKSGSANGQYANDIPPNIPQNGPCNTQQISNTVMPHLLGTSVQPPPHNTVHGGSNSNINQLIPNINNMKLSSGPTFITEPSVNRYDRSGPLTETLNQHNSEHNNQTYNHVNTLQPKYQSSFQNPIIQQTTGPPPSINSMQQQRYPPVSNNHLKPHILPPNAMQQAIPNPMYSNTQQVSQEHMHSQMHMQYTNRDNSVAHSDFNRLWGHPETLDLMQNRHVLPPEGATPMKISLSNQFSDSLNCDPKIFRCTLTKIPETNNLLQKSRLPLGILIHPFRDLSNLPVVSCSQIVRCRACRTYINPFVYFVDSKKWKCNLCYRINELPDEFQYDPVTKSYGDVTRRPEVRSSTIEFIAPSEYMLRPPQPAIYLFLLDVSLLAIQSGYLSLVCDCIAENLDNFPGDARTQIGFLAYNSYLHFYSIAEGYNRPHEITIVDLEDVFLPRPDNLLINLKEHRELINDLLDILPKRFEASHDTGSALGAALQVAFKMMSATGGRVTVFQTCLPNIGPGTLQSREDPNNRLSKDVANLGPATDFYKKLALDFSGQQIAADIFLLNSQYCDLATLSGVSKFSGGCIYHFPLFNCAKKQDCIYFRKTFERYLTRKIGFEAVMRVRCTRGLQIHTFHGNFFVRSTDLLSLPNVNPDSGYGMQISYDESITDVRSICFQAALLYTSSRGERRIRVHTLCLPVVNSLIEVVNSADVQCIIGLLSKMAVDRSIQSNLSDAREAFINATIDILSAFKLTQNLPAATGQLLAPKNLSLLPLYILALLKNIAFRSGISTRLDDRVFAMGELKTLPLDHLMRYIYPDFYQIDCLFMNNENNIAKHQLSAETLDSRSMYLLDLGNKVIIYIGSNVPGEILKSVIGVQNINEIPDICFDLQTLGTNENEKLHQFIEKLNEEKPFPAIIQLIRDTSTSRTIFTEKLIDDRTESSFSYYEFLQHLRTQVK